MTTQSMDLDIAESFLRDARDIRLGIDLELIHVRGLESAALDSAEASRRPSRSGTTTLDGLMELFVDTETFAYDVYHSVAASDWTEADAARLAELRRLIKNGHPGGTERIAAELAALLAKLDLAKSGDRGIQPPRRHPAGFQGGEGIDGHAALQTAIQALYDTANGEVIWQDEFEFVEFTDPATGAPTGKYLLVLPGVTDLSSFVSDPAESLGWASESYTARDTWIAARLSHGSAEIDDNVYARLVQEFIENKIAAGEIPLGADVAIVGHSFGADTALDLASDEDFNGGLINITHVVAAAYHSEPQLPHVQGHTQVAVIQNIYDIPVLGEALLAGDGETAGRLGVEGGEFVVNTLADGVDGLGDAVDGGANAVDLVADGLDIGVDGLADVADIAAEGATDLGIGIVNTPSNVVNWLNPWGDPAPTIQPVDIPDIPDVPNIPTIPSIPDIPEADFVGNTVTQISPNITLVEFEGGFAGAGHEQSEYITYLEESGPDDLGAFFDDMADSGYVGSGEAVSVDVTVPDEIRHPPNPVVPQSGGAS